MKKKDFNLLLSMAACFAAVESGALAVCLGIALLDGGLRGIAAGLTVWAFAQPIIVLVALFSMPIGALLRMILGFAFGSHRPVALASGALIGLAGSVIVAASNADMWSAWPIILIIGLVSGIFGGWTWWQVETHAHGRQRPSNKL